MCAAEQQRSLTENYVIAVVVSHVSSLPACDPQAAADYEHRENRQDETDFLKITRTKRQ